MDRRSFFKGMFGAAAIAALPKPVLDKMVEEPVILPSKLHEIDKEEIPIEKGCPFDEPILDYKSDGLAIWRGDQLVATSYAFSLVMECDLVDVSSLDSNSCYAEWIRGNRSWQLSTRYIDWYVDPEEILLTQEPLNFIMKNKDCQMTGECVLSCMETNISIGHPKYQNCIFEGSGNVTIVVENHDEGN